MLAKAATPQVEFSVNGNDWTFLTSGLKDVTVNFTLVRFYCWGLLIFNIT